MIDDGQVLRIKCCVTSGKGARDALRWNNQVRGVDRIDIGCGNWREEGYFGLDASAGPQVDYVLDLSNATLPFAPNSLDHAVTYHCLEHLQNFERVVHEVWRCLKPNAQFFVCVPYFNTFINIANIFHVRHFNEHSFRFFSSEASTDALPEHIWKFHFTPAWGLKGSANSWSEVEFRTCRVEMDYFPAFRTLPEDEKERLRLSQPNVVHNICFTLQAIKDEHPLKLSDADLIVPQKRQWMLDRNW